MFSSVFCFFEFTAPEIMLILFVTLLLFGGDKLPGLAKGLGKGIREFKDASEGVKREINNQIDNYESKKKDEPAKTEDTPLAAEQSTDNAEGKATETPAAGSITPVANTVAVSSTHAATDHVYDGTPESGEDLHNHYKGITESHEPAAHAPETEKKQTND